MPEPRPSAVAFALAAPGGHPFRRRWQALAAGAGCSTTPSRSCRWTPSPRSARRQYVTAAARVVASGGAGVIVAGGRGSRLFRRESLRESGCGRRYAGAVSPPAARVVVPASSDGRRCRRRLRPDRAAIRNTSCGGSGCDRQHGRGPAAAEPATGSTPITRACAETDARSGPAAAALAALPGVSNSARGLLEG